MNQKSKRFTNRSHVITFDYHPVRMITICDLLFSGLITLMIISKKNHTHIQQPEEKLKKRTQKSFFLLFMWGRMIEGCANKCLFNNSRKWGGLEKYVYIKIVLM